MTQATGALAELLFEFETTWGSDPASPDALSLPFNSCDIAGSQAKNTAQTITGNRNPVRPFGGNIDAAGSIVVPVDYTAMWYWLKLMFGDPTTTGTGPYTHTFTIGDSMPSAVIEKHFDDINTFMHYNGMMAQSFAVSFGGDGELTMTINVAGKSETLPTSVYDATPTSVSLGRLNNFDAAFTEGGTPNNICATQVDINVDFGLDLESRCIGGSGYRNAIPVGIVGVSGTLTGLYEDDTIVDKGAAGTESSLDITLTSGTNSLAFYIDELEYERVTVPIPGPQGLLQTANFQGYYDDDADASAIRVVLINDDAHA